MSRIGRLPPADLDLLPASDYPPPPSSEETSAVCPRFVRVESSGPLRGPSMENGSIQQKFTAALDVLVEQVKRDRSILAAVLCGSLSHDTVWAKSDIDLVLVTVDDRQVDRGHLALDADGVNVHAYLLPRAEFRK